MHELNICLNILNVLERQAHENYFHRVKTIWLEIGELAGIEIDALKFNFPVAASHTLAENATLEIVSVEGRALCHGCQNNVIIKTYFNPCPQCDSYNYTITQGK